MKKFNSWTLTTILMISIAVALPVCGCSPDSSSGLKIIDHSMTVQKFSSDTVQGLAVVSGQAQNISSTNIILATVTVEFYDKDMKLLNTSSATFENLQVGAAWHFGVQFMGPDAWKVANYKISTSAK